MKKLVMKISFHFIFIISFCSPAFCQVDTVARTEEYAMVHARVYYQGGGFVKNIGINPNPAMYIEDQIYQMKDFLADKKGKPFKTVPEMLNYMNKWGWKLVSSDVMEYLGDGDQKSRSSLVNTNEYLQIFMFRREVQNEKKKVSLE